MRLPGYDRWLESGPGGPYDDGEVACPHCEGGKVICCHDDGCGECGGCGSAQCRHCCGTGYVLESDDDEDTDDAR